MTIRNTAYWIAKARTFAAGATEAPCEADIAFMTREVTGASSKGNPTPELRNFGKCLRKSPNLRWLQIHPAGAELPIYKELRARGVKVTTALETSGGASFSCFKLFFRFSYSKNL